MNKTIKKRLAIVVLTVGLGGGISAAVVSHNAESTASHHFSPVRVAAGGGHWSGRTTQH